jgi:hypothetical protein
MSSLVDAILAKGVANTRFMIPCRPLHGCGFIAFTSSSDEPVVTECEIDESRYAVADDYKITLRPLDRKFASESFYIMDLASLMKSCPDDFRII